jgi:hypothetical protein
MSKENNSVGMGASIALLIIVIVGAIFLIMNDATRSDSAIEDKNANSQGGPSRNSNSTTLMSVGDFSGSGLATKSFVDGMFNHTVSAFIPDPPKGKFYEGWLVKSNEFISTGKMTKGGDAYIINVTKKQDLTAYTQIVITVETDADGLDNKPETHVLEGNFSK